ncbi:acyl carrier protein [Pseudomonas sp. SDO5591_S426]
MSGVKRVALDVELEAATVLSEYLSVRHGRIESSSRLVEDLYLDSIGIVEVVMMFNERFSVELPESEIVEWETVKDIYMSIKGVLEN